ncbi:MAG: hypothetical protein ACREQJ_17895 [Candidatus Binatia bacterium]
MRYACVLGGFLLVFGSAGCGSGGGDPDFEGRDAQLSNAEGEGLLPGDLEQTYARVQECVAISAPAPAVVFTTTIECPASGRRCCLASVAPVPCGPDGSARCGTMGRYHEDSQTVELPDECADSAAHEMIHHLLHEAGRGDWQDHRGWEWGCSET